MAKRQLERLFELADKDNSGWVDYEEFFSAFDSTKPYRAVGELAWRDFHMVAELLHGAVGRGQERAMGSFLRLVV